MPDPWSNLQLSRYSVETVAQQARDVLGMKLNEADLRAVTSLLNGLASDMQVMQAMSVGESEPAVIYQASPEDL